MPDEQARTSGIAFREIRTIRENSYLNIRVLNLSHGNLEPGTLNLESAPPSSGITLRTPLPLGALASNSSQVASIPKGLERIRRQAAG